MVKEYKIRLDQKTHERIFKQVEIRQLKEKGRSFSAADIVRDLLDAAGCP